MLPFGRDAERPQRPSADRAIRQQSTKRTTQPTRRGKGAQRQFPVDHASGRREAITDTATHRRHVARSEGSDEKRGEGPQRHIDAGLSRGIDTRSCAEKFRRDCEDSRVSSSGVKKSFHHLRRRHDLPVPDHRGHPGRGHRAQRRLRQPLGDVPQRRAAVHDPDIAGLLRRPVAVAERAVRGHRHHRRRHQYGSQGRDARQIARQRQIKGQWHGSSL